MHLTNWKARRAGGRITINGTDAASGQPAKIVGVDVIEPRNYADGAACVAIDKNGTEHPLSV